jgi:hypothetical protein
LSVDGKRVAEHKIAHAMPFMMTIDETFDVGPICARGGSVALRAAIAANLLQRPRLQNVFQNV